ncbi:MAG: M48 family metallopeptidase [bacterium]
MSPWNLQAIFLIVFLGTEFFFFWLDVKNFRYGSRKARENEEELRDKMGVEDVEKLIRYNRAKTGFSNLKSVVTIVIVALFVYSGLFQQSISVLDRVTGNHWYQGMLFFAALTVIGLLMSLPFSAFETFVLEENFGFNEQGIGLWIKDKIKGLVIGLCFTAILAGTILWFIEFFPTTWWLWGWGLMVGFGLLMQIIYPRFIAPMFNDFEPVEESELREHVNEVFDRAGFHCDQVFTMDASKRSGHSNAYFTGFGQTKRVVLFDTLIDQLDFDEIQSVLAHELAHWKKGHVWKRIGRSALRTGIMFGLVYWMVESAWLYEMFWIPEKLRYVGLLLAGVWLTPITQWLSPLENWMSIRDEREADEFAVEVMETGEGLIQGLYNMVGENLSNPYPHPWYAAFHYTHPPIPDRVESIREAGN